MLQPRTQGVHVLQQIDLLDGSWYADDPHAIWSEMRRTSPVHYDPASDVWGITRHADVLAIEKDPATFSSHTAPRPHGPHMSMMISMDDPDHQRRRSLVSRGFTPKRVAAHEPMLRALCTRIIDAVADRGECDFVWDVAAPLPLLVIAELLGFGPELHDDLLRWSEDLVRASPTDPPDVLQRGAEAMFAFRDAQLAVIADRRKNPRDDVITTLCEAEIDGHRLDDESIVEETLLILIGGDETTRHVLSGGMLALLERPDQLIALRDGSADLGTAVEEMIRWASPVQNMARTATRDVVVGDQEIHEGDQVILFYPSANRDEDVFTDAQSFDIGRTPNPHVAFGFGTHFCLGASLARLECRLMFDELLPRVDDVRLATDDPLPRRASNFISGLEALPIAFRSAAFIHMSDMSTPWRRQPDQVQSGLERWARRVGGGSQVADLRLPQSGMSNDTVLFSLDGEPVVARLAPAPGAPCPTFPTYDLDAERRVIDLVRRRTTVPAPEVVHHEPSDEWLGVPFIVVRAVEGLVPGDNPPYLLDPGGWFLHGTPEDWARLEAGSIALLPELHRVVDGEDTVFLHLDTPGPPLDRLLASQRDYYEWAREGHTIPVLERALDALSTTVPTTDRSVLLWGDGRPGNIIYRDFEPVAALDWEMAGVGPPELDVAWMTFFHRFFASIAQTFGLPPVPAMFDRADTAATYHRLGGVELDDLAWYEAFAGLRFGIIVARMTLRAIVFGAQAMPDDPDQLVLFTSLLDQLLAEV